MERDLTPDEELEACNALIDWFKSQGIKQSSGIIVMLRLIARQSRQFSTVQEMLHARKVLLDALGIYMLEELEAQFPTSRLTAAVEARTAPPSNAECLAMTRAFIGWLQSQNIDLPTAMCMICEFIGSQSALTSQRTSLKSIVELIETTTKAITGHFWIYAGQRFPEARNDPRYAAALRQGIEWRKEYGG